MVEAVAFCHSQNIIHRDIKFENFLIDATLCGDALIKLTDFGLACKYDPNDPPTRKCGSLSVVAPEVLTDDHYCPKVDCWALGCILFEMIAGFLPFETDDPIQHQNNIVKQ